MITALGIVTLFCGVVATVSNVLATPRDRTEKAGLLLAFMVNVSVATFAALVLFGGAR